MSKGKGKQDRKGKSSSADRSRPDTDQQPPASAPRKKSPRPSKAAEPVVDKPKRGRGRPVAEELQHRCTATSKTTGMVNFCSESVMVCSSSCRDC